jgi:DNA-binding transcriptional LysR family regulator
MKSHFLAIQRKLSFMLDSRRLRVLVAVERARSLAGAAEAMGYTPSAVSQQVRALEREVGAVLLERRGRGVTLTEPGAALARHARRVAEALDAAEAEVHAIAGLRAGTLRLGWFSTAGATLVPRAIARFRERFPEVGLVLEEADPDDCARRLLEAASTSRWSTSSGWTTRCPPSCASVRCWRTGSASRCRRTTAWPAAAPSRWRTWPGTPRSRGVKRGSGRVEPRIAFQTDEPRPGRASSPPASG